MLLVIMASVEQVMKEALALPSAARALLAEKLVESLEFDVDETLQTLWTDNWMEFTLRAASCSLSSTRKH